MACCWRTIITMKKWFEAWQVLLVFACVCLLFYSSPSTAYAEWSVRSDITQDAYMWSSLDFTEESRNTLWSDVLSFNKQYSSRIYFEQFRVKNEDWAYFYAPIPVSGDYLITGGTFNVYVKSVNCDTEAHCTIDDGCQYLDPSYILTNIARLNASFDEATLTYNNRPRPVDASTVELLEPGGYWYAFDIGKFARNWSAGNYPNYGVTLQHPFSVYKGSVEYTSRHEATNKPYMTFTYLKNPINLTCTGKTDKSLTISWSNNGNSSDTKYQVKLDGNVVWTGTGTSRTLTGLKANTSYSVSVSAAFTADGSTYLSKPVTKSFSTLSSLSLSISSPQNNQIFSAVSGYNQIAVSGTVNDPNIGDILKVYYRIDGSAGQAGTQLGSNITSNGANQPFSGNISVSSIAEGTHTLYLWVEDNKGSKSSEISRTFRIDKTGPTAPSISFTSPSGYTSGSWSTLNVTFSISGGSDSGSGIAKYQYSINGGAWTNGSSGTISTEGQTTIRARAVDNVGNAGTSTPSYTVKIDKTGPTAPSISFGAYTPGSWTNSNVSFSISGGSDTGSGIAKYQYSLNGGAWTDGSSRTISTEGQTTIKARAVDNAGNAGTAAAVQTAKIDKTAPSISTNPAPGTITAGANVTITVTDSSSGVDKVYYKWGVEPATLVTPYTGAISTPVPDTYGDHTLTVTAYDTAGNANSGKTYTYTVPDTTPPAITINPDNGTYTGDINISITCIDTESGVANSYYAWDNDETPPGDSDSSWVPFTSPGAVKQAGQGTQYLHIRAADNAGNQASAYKTYIIIPKLAIAVRTDGVMTIGGTGGRMLLLSKHGQELKDETWGHSASNIYAIQTDHNGKVLFAGQDGKYQLRAPDGNMKNPETWYQPGYSIKTITPLYNTDGTPSGEFLMAGNGGRWQVRNANGILSTTKKGICDIGQITGAAGREDGYIILAGSEGKVKIIHPDGKTIVKEETWSDSKQIKAVLALPDGSMLFAGEGGKYQRRDPAGVWKSPGTWDYTEDIRTLTFLPNGDILMTGGDGYFQELNADNEYNLTPGTKGQYDLTNIQSAFPREDGMVVIQDSEWKRQYYKYDPEFKLLVKSVTNNSVVLQTAWDGRGFKNAVAEKSTDGINWTEASCTWNTEGTEVTVTGLSSAVNYYLRIKTPLGLPVEYKSKKVSVETQ